MKNILENVLSQVKDQKAEGDVILNRASSLNMSVQQNALAEYKVSSSQVLGLRLIKDGKVGLSYTESLDEQSLKTLVKQAVENAQTNSPNQHERILDHAGHISDEIEYPEVEASMPEKVQRVLTLESELKNRDPRFLASPYNGYSEGEYFGYYMSTKGRSTSYKDKMYTIYTGALLGEGQKKATYYDSHMTHTYQELDWEKVISHTLDYAQQILKEAPIATGKYEVRLTEDALSSLLGVFSSLFSAKAVMDKVNPWGNKLGAQVTAAGLSIEDHPQFARSFRINKVDSEGVETKPMYLVKDGELKDFYHNSITANHFKTQTNAHGARGPQGPLGVSGNTTIIHGKKAKPLPPKYLEIFQLDGLHAGTNRITGDFSLPVKGFVWENGEKKMTFGNVTLSGNFFNMLKEVEVVGTELMSSRDRSFFSVPLIFNGLSIAGA